MLYKLHFYHHAYPCIVFAYSVGRNVKCYYPFVVGYLRLKRRYRILCIIRDLKTAKAYVQPSNKVHLQKLESVSISRKCMHTNMLAHLVYLSVLIMD